MCSTVRTINLIICMMIPTLSLVNMDATPAMRTRPVAFVPSPKSSIHKEALPSIVIALSLLQVLSRVMSFATKQPMAPELPQLCNRRSSFREMTGTIFWPMPFNTEMVSDFKSACECIPIDQGGTYTLRLVLLRQWGVPHLVNGLQRLSVVPFEGVSDGAASILCLRMRSTLVRHQRWTNRVTLDCEMIMERLWLLTRLTGDQFPLSHLNPRLVTTAYLKSSFLAKMPTLREEKVGAVGGRALHRKAWKGSSQLSLGPVQTFTEHNILPHHSLWLFQII